METDLHKITLDDKMAADNILKNSDRRFCEYTFGNMYCWGVSAGLELCISDGTLIFGYPKTERFYMPVANDTEKTAAAVNKLIGNYKRLTIMSISAQDKSLLEQKFNGVFEFSEDTRYFDYIYESEKLRSLSGKKLSAKRNHINAFLSDGEWRIEKITQDNKEQLFTFNRQWCRDLCGHMSGSLRNEMCAAELGIKNFDKLGFCGIMLYKDDTLVAYSYGEPINGDTFCVHVEKADADVRGAYQMINREFARKFCTDFEYINREDDAGDEGLRRAKQSYYPTDKGLKFKAVVKE